MKKGPRYCFTEFLRLRDFLYEAARETKVEIVNRHEDKLFFVSYFPDLIAIDYVKSGIKENYIEFDPRNGKSHPLSKLPKPEPKHLYFCIADIRSSSILERLGDRELGGLRIGYMECPTLKDVLYTSLGILNATPRRIYRSEKIFYLVLSYPGLKFHSVIYTPERMDADYLEFDMEMGKVRAVDFWEPRVRKPIIPVVRIKRCSILKELEGRFSRLKI